MSDITRHETSFYFFSGVVTALCWLGESVGGGEVLWDALEDWGAQAVRGTGSLERGTEGRGSSMAEVISWPRRDSESA